MMNESGLETQEAKPVAGSDDRRWIRRYALLTIFLFGPLLISFALIRNLYPISASTMMMAGGRLHEGTVYYILRGETLTGETISLPPVELTNALTGRAFGFVSATVENKSFSIRSPHPANLELLSTAGETGHLPAAARLPELLHAWGSIYNSRLPQTSSRRLQAVRLDAYRWDGGSYSNYDRFVQSWKVEL